MPEKKAPTIQKQVAAIVGILRNLRDNIKVKLGALDNRVSKLEQAWVAEVGDGGNGAVEPDPEIIGEDGNPLDMSLDDEPNPGVPTQDDLHDEG